MILVTGGTGLVGAHLLFELSKTDTKIRAIYRKDSSFKGVKSVFQFLGDTKLQQYQKIEWLEADILQIPELEDAFKGISYVYHCAALVSFIPSDFDKLIKTNVEGTANIVSLCIHHKISKLCYVSSVATLAHTHNKPATEEDFWNPGAENNVYAISKNGAETEVWRGSQEGLNMVIVNPSVIIGYGFPNSGMGFLLEKIEKGLSYYPSGGTGWVYAEDVAKAMIILMKSNINNERFILNSDNWSYQKILKIIAENKNTSIPDKKIPNFILQIGWRIDTFISFLGLKKQRLTKLLVRSLSHQSSYSGEKITQKTNFNYTNLETAIKKITSYKES